jgi:hypothetical protein
MVLLQSQGHVQREVVFHHNVSIVAGPELSAAAATGFQVGKVVDGHAMYQRRHQKIPRQEDRTLAHVSLRRVLCQPFVDFPAKPNENHAGLCGDRQLALPVGVLAAERPPSHGLGGSLRQNGSHGLDGSRRWYGSHPHFGSRLSRGSHHHVGYF